MWSVHSSHSVDSGQRSVSTRRDLVSKGDCYLFNYSVSDSEILANLKPIDVERMKMIEEEFSFLREQNNDFTLPETISDHLMVSLLRETSLTRRIKVYRKHSLRRRKRLQPDRDQGLKKRPLPPSDPGIERMVRFISKTSMMRFYNARLFSMVMNGDAQKLIFDFSFEDEIEVKDIYSVAHQLRMVTASNRISKDPFEIVLSGLERGSRQFYIMSKFLGVYNDPTGLVCDLDDAPYARTETCVLRSADEQSRRDFVYLTPHSPHLLRRFDHSKTYIVGGLNENRCPPILTILKARRLNIRHARLPVMKFSDVRGRRQSGWSLTRVFFVLHSIKTTGKYPRTLKEP